MFESPGTFKNKLSFYFIQFPLILIIIPIGFMFEFMTTLPFRIICRNSKKTLKR